jgi:ribose-phosphate pyrophosphokinase
MTAQVSAGGKGRGGVVVWTPGQALLGEALCAALGDLGWRAGEVEARQFPDGEHYVNWLGERRQESGRGGEGVSRALVVGSLDSPDRRWLQLAFFAEAMRSLGATRVGWVAPYLGYLRQDEQFKPGEVVTARCFARMVGGVFDEVWTVDPHLHRVHSLQELYAIPATAVSAVGAIRRWVSDHVAAPLLVGPDEESAQWVAPIAAALGVPWVVLHKTRRGDRDVEVAPAVAEQGWLTRTPVLVDDIASTGQTMIAALAQVRAMGVCAPAVCVAIHPVFVPGALALLREALRGAHGDGVVVSCNTIPHETNAIDVSAALVEALRASTLA